MATPRHQLVDPDNPLFYHLVSRCVRRGWLCGFDRATRKNYKHRKEWLLSRLEQLGSAFAVDVYAYAIMSNHFHLVVYYDPNASALWSSEEVVDRWLRVCPPRLPDGSVNEDLKAIHRATLLNDPEQIAQRREKLGSLSLFMKMLKQPIARRANIEDGCLGHFFVKRFYSGALLSDATVIAAMAYVDLNPIRAKIAKTVAQAKHTAIHARLKAIEDPSDLHEYLKPIICGVNQTAPFKITLGEYRNRLEALVAPTADGWTKAKLSKWRDQVASLKKRQRVYGPESMIKSWITKRGFQMREIPLPE